MVPPSLGTSFLHQPALLVSGQGSRATTIRDRSYSPQFTPCTHHTIGFFHELCQLSSHPATKALSPLCLGSGDAPGRFIHAGRWLCSNEHFRCSIRVHLNELGAVEAALSNKNLLEGSTREGFELPQPQHAALWGPSNPPSAAGMCIHFQPATTFKASP